MRIIRTIASINIALEVFGIFLSVIIALCLYVGQGEKSKMQRVFMQILFCNIAVLFNDIITWILNGNSLLYARIMIQTSTFISFFLRYAYLSLCMNYLVAFIRANNPNHIKSNIFKQYLHLANILFGVCVLLLIYSQFNHMYYWFDGNNNYVRGNLFWVSQIWGLVYLVFCLFLLIYYWKYLNKRDAIFLILCILFPFLAMGIQVFVYGLALFDITLSIILAVAYIAIQAKQSKRLKEKEIELAQSRIAIMLSQIQPHFLFNSLTAISHLCEENPKKAKEVTISFASYVKGNMDSLNLVDMIPFDMELIHVENYLNLEKAIYGDALTIHYEIAIRNFKVPALSIQPIVENAIKHGIGGKEDGGRVVISTWETEHDFQVKIEDDGVGFQENSNKDSSRSHIGIDNVKSRMKEQCGGTLDIYSEGGKGTEAIYSFPKTR